MFFRHHHFEWSDMVPERYLTKLRKLCVWALLNWWKLLLLNWCEFWPAALWWCVFEKLFTACIFELFNGNKLKGELKDCCCELLMKPIWLFWPVFAWVKTWFMKFGFIWFLVALRDTFIEFSLSDFLQISQKITSPK